MIPIAARTTIPTATGAITLLATACVPWCVEEVLLRAEWLEGVLVSKNLNLIVVLGGEAVEVA